MSLTVPIPDIEQVVGSYLRAHPDVEPLARVSGELPKSFTSAWVKLVQLDAKDAAVAFNSDTEHLVSFLIQLDCYAGSVPGNAQAEASALARAVRAALIAMKGQTLDGVVIANVGIVSDARLPDQAFEPWRERRILTVEIHAHA